MTFDDLLRMNLDLITEHERMLIAAVGIMSTMEGFTNKTPHQVYEYIKSRTDDFTPSTRPVSIHNFEKHLTSLINVHNIENDSDTPDFVLAEFMVACLRAFNYAIKTRSDWVRKPEKPKLKVNNNPRDYDSSVGP